MLARHPSRRPGASAVLALLAGLAAVPAAARQALPTGSQAVPRPPEGQTRPANPKIDARKAPSLVLSPAWTLDLPAPPLPGVAVDAARGYLVLRSSTLVAVALETGTVVWSVPVGADASPPAAGGGLVFLPRGRSVDAFDAASGAHRWRAEVGAPVSAPMLWTADGLVVATERSVESLRPATGERAWARSLEGPVRLEPVADADRVYLALDGGPLIALDRTTGRAVWETPLPAPPTALDAGGGRVFVGGSDKFLYCFSADRGTRKWRWRTGAPPVGRVAVDRHHVYFVALDNVLRALDRARGQQIWKALIPHRPLGGVVLGSNLLWVPGIAAEVSAFQVADGGSAGVCPLAGDPAAAPAPLFSASGVFEGVFVVSGGGTAQWLTPGPPPLPARAIRHEPMGLPSITGSLSKGQLAAGAW